MQIFAWSKSWAEAVHVIWNNVDCVIWYSKVFINLLVGHLQHHDIVNNSSPAADQDKKKVIFCDNLWRKVEYWCWSIWCIDGSERYNFLCWLTCLVWIQSCSRVSSDYSSQYPHYTRLQTPHTRNYLINWHCLLRKNTGNFANNWENEALDYIIKFVPKHGPWYKNMNVVFALKICFQILHCLKYILKLLRHMLSSNQIFQGVLTRLTGHLWLL